MLADEVGWYGNATTVPLLDNDQPTNANPVRVGAVGAATVSPVPKLPFATAEPELELNVTVESCSHLANSALPAIAEVVGLEIRVPLEVLDHPRNR